MRVTFDTAKNARNVSERGLSFERVADLDWVTAWAVPDDRRDYGETRLNVMGFLGKRLHVAIVTFRDGAVHVISFRKANIREVRQYERARA